MFTHFSIKSCKLLRSVVKSESSVRVRNQSLFVDDMRDDPSFLLQLLLLSLWIGWTDGKLNWSSTMDKEVYQFWP